MGGVHLRAWREVADVTLTAVFANDERQLTGELTAQGNLGRPTERFDFSAVKKYRELGPLLADEEIDAVDLCLPTFMHEEVAVAALRAGKHVLVEKPLALNGASGRRMIAEAEKSGRILMCAQVLRFIPEYMALRNALPRLGAVRSAFFRRRCAAPAWGGWLKDPKLSGGGVFDLLIHDVDICLHLFGRPEGVSAVGHLDTAASLDILHGQLHYPFGTVVVTGGWQHEGAFPFSMEYSVTLDGGTVEFSSAGRPPTVYAQGEEALPLPGADGYEAEIAYFAACCKEGRQPERCLPGESSDAVELMRALLASREQNGRRIECSNLE